MRRCHALSPYTGLLYDVLSIAEDPVSLGRHAGGLGDERVCLPGAKAVLHGTKLNQRCLSP